jgi:hypothetical protein
MKELEIPLTFKGQKLNLPAKFHQYGYTYKIEVDLNGFKIFFERDEERNWRALIAQEEIEKQKHIDQDLLTSIASVLDDVSG